MNRDAMIMIFFRDDSVHSTNCSAPFTRNVYHDRPIRFAFSPRATLPLSPVFRPLISARRYLFRSLITTRPVEAQHSEDSCDIHSPVSLRHPVIQSPLNSPYCLSVFDSNASSPVLVICPAYDFCPLNLHPLTVVCSIRR